MANFRKTQAANADLIDIARFISADKPEAAVRLIERLHARFARLAEFPGLGRLREELTPGLRSFAVGNYVIFYRECDGGIEVIRVLSGYRDLDKLLAEPQ